MLLFSSHIMQRAVAQWFSVHVWGTWGRRFKSAQPEKRQVADRRAAFFIPGEPQCFPKGKHEVDGCCAAASETSPKKGRSPTGGLPFSYLGNLSVFRRENSTRKALYSSLIL